MDVSDPDQPVETECYDASAISREVAVLGDLVYVADGMGGLVILHCKEPARLCLPLVLRNW